MFGREIRQFSLEQKKLNDMQAKEINSDKCSAIRARSIQGQRRIYERKNKNMNKTSENYWRKVDEEDRKKGKVEQEMKQLEILESELIHRLQNSQKVHQAVFNDLMNAMKTESTPSIV